MEVFLFIFDVLVGFYCYWWFVFFYVRSRSKGLRRAEAWAKTDLPGPYDSKDAAKAIEVDLGKIRNFAKANRLNALFVKTVINLPPELAVYSHLQVLRSQAPPRNLRQSYRAQLTDDDAQFAAEAEAHYRSALHDDRDN